MSTWRCVVLAGALSSACAGGDGARPSVDAGSDGGTSACATSLALPSAVRSIAVAASHACLLLEDGTVHCWGKNDKGQLGVVSRGPTGTRTYEPCLFPTRVPGVDGATAIAVGGFESCALLGGTVKCWGDNGQGQIGNGTSMTFGITPTEVHGLTDAVEIAVGGAHVCARRATGGLVCWGDNFFCQLGAAGVDASEPRAVSGVTDVRALTAGSVHTCALLAGNTVQCWGSFAFGQGAVCTPRSVGLTDATQISAGANHTCARREGGTVSCWGGNGAGQLGDGSTKYARETPLDVTGLTDVQGVAGGGAHTCALHTSGAVSCWGTNAHGELGDGTTTAHLTATAVPGASGVRALSAGGTASVGSTAALLASGGLRWWGLTFATEPSSSVLSPVAPF